MNRDRREGGIREIVPGCPPAYRLFSDVDNRGAIPVAAREIPPVLPAS